VLNIKLRIMTFTTVAAALISIVELPYAYGALEPYISAETMHFHHDKHYAGYVAKLNELIEGSRYATMPLEEIVRQSEGAIFNNAAQAWNHVFYFEQFAPNARHHPEGKLLRSIEMQFGSVDELKRSMVSTATSLFGSGWVWLAADNDGMLYVIAKPNAGTPLTDGLHPLLCLDVWEHAYYLDYRNIRKDAAAECFKVVDWAKVEERYENIAK
jgi:Fe-Mn family superoxide dismutase